ncbi:MAG: hypothetical protein K2O46_08245, partial [Bacteroidales bacterium]|nr:hypothetical protein [Bacteroidales bacterium]
TMENAPNSGLEQLRRINERFNKQIIDVENGLHTGFISLGKPGPILLSTGLRESELYIREAVLRSHMKKHGLSAADLQNLPLAIQTPLMVYEWGSKAKSLIVITNLEVTGGRKITAAIKLERQGQKLEVNELVSIHGKDIGYFLKEMFDAKLGGLEQGLRYVDKTKIAVWLDLTPPKGADVQTEQQLYITKILQNFENPKCGG